MVGYPGVLNTVCFALCSIRRTWFFTQSDIVQEREAGFVNTPDLTLDTTDDDAVVSWAGACLAGLGSEWRPWQALEMEEKTNTNKSKKWSIVAEKVKGDRKRRAWRAFTVFLFTDCGVADLGYVPFIEDETGNAFVMGQREFLERYNVCRLAAPGCPVHTQHGVQVLGHEGPPGCGHHHQGG